MTRRQCHEVKVDGRCDISPEVLEANIDDVVAWTFDGRRQRDVHMLGKNNVSVNDKKGKRRANKHDVNHVELDAATLAGQAVKPRSVLPNYPASCTACMLNMHEEL